MIYFANGSPQLEFGKIKFLGLRLDPNSTRIYKIMGVWMQGKLKYNEVKRQIKRE